MFFAHAGNDFRKVLDTPKPHMLFFAACQTEALCSKAARELHAKLLSEELRYVRLADEKRARG